MKNIRIILQLLELRDSDPQGGSVLLLLFMAQLEIRDDGEAKIWNKVF